MNNSEREMWINNDEYLYNWRQREKGTMRDFIKRNRRWIDNHIDENSGARWGGEPTHDPRGTGEWT